MIKFKFQKPTIEFSIIEDCVTVMWLGIAVFLDYFILSNSRLLKLAIVIEAYVMLAVFIVFRKSLKPTIKAVVITAFGALSALAAYVFYYTDYKRTIKKISDCIPEEGKGFINEVIRFIPMVVILTLILFVVLNVNLKDSMNEFKNDESLRQNARLSYVYTLHAIFIILFIVMLVTDGTCIIRLAEGAWYVMYIEARSIQMEALLYLELKDAREIKMLGNEE